MKKIKVVFGLNDLWIGGMERQFVEQSKLFNRDKFEIVLITLFNDPTKPHFYDQLPSDIEVHKLNFKGIKDIRSWLQLYRLLRALKPDIVVSSLFFANTVFRILKPFVGYHSIAREHNTYIDKSFGERFTDRLLAHFSKTVVAVSKTVADFTAQQEHISREKFTVIRNGINVQTVHEQLEALPSAETIKDELGFRPDEHILLYVGRLVPQKNVRLLIEGFKEWPKDGYVLAIVGEGSERDAIERVADDRVHFFGHRDDVWKFYKIADAFVATSYMEGLSNSYLEALASGLPLIVTNTAGTDEILKDSINGFLISEATPRGVASRFEEFANSDQATLRKAAADTARQFDIHETVKKYENLFESVL